ncbi:MAG: signal peptidase I [Candidatus Moranbacteria bacterium]|nr:signal peptidase I [Candidatus Moranbacteria bacterium]
MSKIAKIFKIIVNTILFLLIILGLFVVFSFVPFPGNYKVFTVQSGSMEPAIKTGSLIFVRPEADYGVGDVVTRRTTDPKVTITHRIVSKEEVSGQIAFETKGDANDSPDGEKFTRDGIIGKEIFKVPYIGYPVGYAKTTPGLILLIVVPSVIIIYDELNKIKEEIKLIMKRKSGKKSEAGPDPAAKNPEKQPEHFRREEKNKRIV